MKSKIISSALLSFALVISAFAAKPKLSATREISVTASFTKISVDNNITLILVQDESKSTITVSGDEKAIKNIEAAIRGDELKILSKKHADGRNIIVYVPVKNIFTIELLNGSSVSGEGVLKFPDLTVIINNECHLALNTLGRITIKSNEECDFIYEKNERYKVISLPEKTEKYKVLTATLQP